jgi:hypothetical protein
VLSIILLPVRPDASGSLVFFRFAGITFLVLESVDIRSAALRIVFLRFRPIPAFFSGLLSSALDLLRSLLLLSFWVLVVLTFGLLSRISFLVLLATTGVFSPLIVLPMREVLAKLNCLRGFAFGCFLVTAAGLFGELTGLAIREVLSKLTRLGGFAFGCFLAPAAGRFGELTGLLFSCAGSRPLRRTDRAGYARGFD